MPCCELAGVHSSPSVGSISALRLRASANTAPFKYYDHKPNFQEGQRLLPVQKNTGSDTQYKCLQVSSREHIGCIPATTYAPQLHENRRFSPYDNAEDDDDDDGERIHSNMLAENQLKEIYREGTHSNRPVRLARDGSKRALHRMHAPYFPAGFMQPTNLSSTKLYSESVAVLNVPSIEDMSFFDDDDEEQGPREGDREFELPSAHLGKAFNRLDFARVYNLVALRVSLAECKSLAYRLKGHLLNWPRISNIARVDGDDMDWDTQRFWTNNEEQRAESVEDSLLRAVYGSIAPSGPVAKRLNAARKLSARRFRYLESLSRPGRKAMKEMRKEIEGDTTKRSPNKYYVVELQDCPGEKLGFDPRLQSFGFSTKKWIGPFRLLLLDAKYAGQPASKLPMAVQMLLNQSEGHRKYHSKQEIVPCKLTLFYAYWSMEEILNHLLSKEKLMPLSIKIMGHIAVLSLKEQHFPVKYLIGKVVLDKHRPKVKTVINKLESINGPAFEVLAGNHSVVTTIVEDEIPFLVNMATVSWDTELASERQRLVKKFNRRDIVCDVFAGAGPLSLTAAKKVWRVFANDASPEALKYLAKNVADNQLQAKVELYNLDCCMFIRKLLAFKRPVLMTQVVVSLPTSGDTILDIFKGAFDRHTWPAVMPLPTLHVYGYSDAVNPENDFYNIIVCRLGLETEAVEVYHVKQVEPGRWLICASFQLPEAIAFDD